MLQPVELKHPPTAQWTGGHRLLCHRHRYKDNLRYSYRNWDSLEASGSPGPSVSREAPRTKQGQHIIQFHPTNRRAHRV